MRCAWISLLLVSSAVAADLTLAFEPRWSGTPLAVPSAAVASAAGQSLTLTRVAGLVSGVALLRADGGTVRLDGQFGHFDAEAGKLALPFRGVPDGDYAGLTFDLGVPADINHGDPGRWPAGHPLNPLVNALHWSWQGGYVFVALEGRWQAGGGEARGFSYHVATDARRMTVRFAADFRVEGATTVTLALDLARVLHARRLAADDGSESTHSGEGDVLAPQLATALERAWFWLGASATPRLASANSDVARRVSGGTATPLAFTVPDGFPQPALPADNPLTREGVALGAALFFEPRLSGNGTQSCASCHAPAAAFSDTVAVSLGALGTAGTRNAMPLFNLAWSDRYAWDGGQARIRDQSLAALKNPVEMDGDPATVAATLAADAAWREKFAAAFGDATITPERIGLALEQYQLTLVSADSRFDRALRGAATLTDEEKRGFELFLTEYDPVRGRTGADCFHCHGGALFTDFGFKNNGLDLASRDAGRARVTGSVADAGKFKTPSLRNVAVTGPYMHDGRFATLEDVIAHYDHGVQRAAALDPNLAKHPGGGIRLTAADQRALVAFLRTLTDRAFER